MGDGVRGTVIEQLPQALYRVSLDSGHVITAHGTGDIRRNFVRILVGDRVVVRVSPFDVTRGRIIGRSNRVAAGRTKTTVGRAGSPSPAESEKT
jgi:translation initiation factor IF-1